MGRVLIVQLATESHCPYTFGNLTDGKVVMIRQVYKHALKGPGRLRICGGSTTSHVISNLTLRTEMRGAATDSLSLDPGAAHSANCTASVA